MTVERETLSLQPATRDVETHARASRRLLRIRQPYMDTGRYQLAISDIQSHLLFTQMLQPVAVCIGIDSLPRPYAIEPCTDSRTPPCRIEQFLLFGKERFV